MRLSDLAPGEQQIPYQQNLRSTTWRGFTGGWNVLDDDMSLSYRYATILDNMYHDSNGITRVRQGFELFVNIISKLSDPLAHPVEMYYFSNALVIACSNGEIVKVMGDGVASRIWDAAIAAALPGAPTGWSNPTDFVSFEIFNGHLIVCNGIDKPLDIDGEFFVEYLQDAGTFTNINVPICRYVVSVGRYLIMAGDPLEPDRVHISAKDAAGTWFGDPPPNDATHLDVGSVIPGASVIRGLMAFRGRLIVMFAEGLIFGQLGIEDENGNHTPDFNDGVEGFGSISHRSGVTYGDDGLFLDLEGVPSIKRTVLSTAFKPERVSEFIDPEIKSMLTSLSFEAMENRAFSVYHKEEGQFMLFIPNAELLANTTETVAFVFTYRPALKHEAWSRYRGMNFICGARSLAGNLFFADADGNVWLYGSRENRPINTDYTIAGEGIPIEFTWEMPWFDLGRRDHIKQSKHISFDTRGASEFTAQMFVDNFDTPSLEMRFSAGEQGLFGGGDQPYGGGRNSAIKKHYSWPTKFEIAKLRFTGQSDAGLAFVSVTLRYLMGGINR